MPRNLMALAILAIALAVALLAPDCWEDETLTLSTQGISCVPYDNMTAGYRP